MKVVCRKSDGAIVTFLREGTPAFDPSTEVVLDVQSEPDMENQKWNGGTGLRAVTVAERAARDDAMAQQAAQASLSPAVLALLEEINALRLLHGLPQLGPDDLAQRIASRRP